MNYISPIEIIVSDIGSRIENEILHAVKNVRVLVDKEELIKALDFDREQYKKGWNNAITKALDETFEIHTEDGVFRVVQEETLIGLGMAMEDKAE